MAWYTPILWYLVGFGVGILLFLVGPILMGRFLPDEMAERIGGYYDGLAMRTADRLLMARRRVGASYSPEPSTYDGEKGGERIKMDGEKHHFFDDLGVMGTFHNKTFGLVLEGVGVVLDPFIASMADYEIPRRDDGSWLEENDDGDIEYVPDVEVPETVLLADLKLAADMIPGELGSKDPTTAETLFEKSQRLFGKPKTTDVMILIVAWGVGLGGWIALQYVTGGGGMSAPSVPGFPAVVWP